MLNHDVHLLEYLHGRGQRVGHYHLLLLHSPFLYGCRGRIHLHHEVRWRSGRRNRRVLTWPLVEQCLVLPIRLGLSDLLCVCNPVPTLFLVRLLPA